MEILDPVIVVENIPDKGLKRGEKGAIVGVFAAPNLAYEVEFVDQLGRNRKMETLLPHQIKPCS